MHNFHADGPVTTLDRCRRRASATRRSIARCNRRARLETSPRQKPRGTALFPSSKPDATSRRKKQLCHQFNPITPCLMFYYTTKKITADID